MLVLSENINSTLKLYLTDLKLNIFFKNRIVLQYTMNSQNRKTKSRFAITFFLDDRESLVARIRGGENHSTGPCAAHESL